MFKMITWSQYLGTVAILLVVYYAYVGLVYYRAELTGLLTGKGGKATGGSPATTPTSLLNRGPLIPKSAVLLPVAAAPVAAPKEAASDAETDKGEDKEEQETETDEVPATVEVGKVSAQEETTSSKENDFNNVDHSYTDKFSKFTGAASYADQPTVQDGSTSSAEYDEESFMIGVTQLNSAFDRAAAGELTQQQLTKEVPALANTAVLMAFFKTSTKAAQQITATTYSDVVEPVLN